MSGADRRREAQEFQISPKFSLSETAGSLRVSFELYSCMREMTLAMGLAGVTFILIWLTVTLLCIFLNATK